MPRHDCRRRRLPLSASIEAGLWSVRTYERARCADEASHDIALVAPAGGRLRPHRLTPGHQRHLTPPPTKGRRGEMFRDTTPLEIAAAYAPLEQR